MVLVHEVVNERIRVVEVHFTADLVDKPAALKIDHTGLAVLDGGVFLHFAPENNVSWGQYLHFGTALLLLIFVQRVHLTVTDFEHGFCEFAVPEEEHAHIAAALVFTLKRERRMICVVVCVLYERRRYRLCDFDWQICHIRRAWWW